MLFIICYLLFFDLSGGLGWGTDGFGIVLGLSSLVGLNGGGVIDFLIIFLSLILLLLQV